MLRMHRLRTIKNTPVLLETVFHTLCATIEETPLSYI